MDLARELRDVRMPNGAIIGLNWAGAAELERQQELIERYRAALRQIACYGDEGAERHLAATGSYSMFDEPGSVESARAVLESE